MIHIKGFGVIFEIVQENFAQLVFREERGKELLTPHGNCYLFYLQCVPY